MKKLSIGLPKNISTPELANKGESKNFFRTALAWSGSVTPKVLLRVAVAILYSILVKFLHDHFSLTSLPITPFEYSGTVLGLLLVLRMNAGLDRWWEARKIWGSIVNQSRNLALIGYGYLVKKDTVATEFLRWVACWPHIMCESLRKESQLLVPLRLLGQIEVDSIRLSNHMPTYAAFKITQLLMKLRERGLDDFAFQRAERERALLIDAIGACERIRNTPIPFVLAIKVRRFIFLFLLLLPLAITSEVGWGTPLIAGLVAYPLFALDEIGAELQNPFSPRNLSHLPLIAICEMIEKNVMGLSEIVLTESESEPKLVTVSKNRPHGTTNEPPEVSL